MRLGWCMSRLFPLCCCAAALLVRPPCVSIGKFLSISPIAYLINLTHSIKSINQHSSLDHGGAACGSSHRSPDSRLSPLSANQRFGGDRTKTFPPISALDSVKSQATLNEAGMLNQAFSGSGGSVDGRCWGRELAWIR